MTNSLLRVNRTSFVLLILLHVTGVHAQYGRQTAGILATNAALHGLSAGTGALVNTPRDDRPRWRVFAKAFAQGVAGGTVMHGGRTMVHGVERYRNLARMWPAKVVHAFGASVAENAAYGRKPLSHFHMNAWGVRFDYDVPDRRFRGRVMTTGIASYFVVNAPDHRFNFGRSLATGQLFFDILGDGLADGTGFAAGRDGRNYGPAVSVGRIDYLSSDEADVRYWGTAAHELSHALQFDSRIHFNPMAQRLSDRAATWRPYDTARKFLYFDLNGPTDYAVYYTVGGGVSSGCYWENIIERNTEHFSARRYVGCP